MSMMITFADLFAGIGGFRLGFEQACADLSLNCKCVLSSEIKKSAIAVYTQNFDTDCLQGDITKLINIPKFDYLLAGFPCQAFSLAGRLKGFNDPRGRLFYTIVNII